jgi:hypothetical protein
MTMLAILSAVCFLLCAFGLDHLGVVGLLALGLALLALHVAYPWTPWVRRTA